MRLFLPILEALNRRGVEYVVVGGLAVVLHGHPRLTNDVDIVLSLKHENVTAAIEALTELGLQPRAPVDARDFIDPEKRRDWVENKAMVVFSLADPRNPLISIDLFAEPPLDWPRLWQNSVLMRLNGTEVRVCSLEDLIEIKRRSGRTQDLLDIEELTNGHEA